MGRTGVAPTVKGPCQGRPTVPAGLDNRMREPTPHEWKRIRPEAQLGRNPSMLPFITFATETKDLVPRNVQREALGGYGVQTVELRNFRTSLQ